MNRQELEFLDGFEKRMKIVAAIHSIVHRGNRRMEIEGWFQPGQMDNIIVSVLVFIMERTLAEDEECTLDSIANFIAQILPAYDLHFSADALRQLTEYIIKDILQNGGETRYYPVMTYGQGMTEVRIRLIDDKLREDERGYELTYQLTDQGYDLLFRTKEVEQEISFTIEELKLRELIKRKNYRKAISQSSNLVQMVRQKKNDLRRFLEKIRGNIYEVDIREFEKLVGSTYALLEEEYDMMNEILGMIALAEERLADEEQTRGYLDEEMKKARREIAVIRRNIHLTIQEQKELILERHDLSSIYKETIMDSFTLARSKKYDFEQEILKKLERCPEDRIPELWQLFNPLFKPRPQQTLNLLSLFAPQSRLQQETEDADQIALEELGEDQERLRVERINEANTDLLSSILEFAGEHQAGFSLSEWVTQLQENEELFSRLTRDDLLYHSLLKLYDLGLIDLKKWQQEPHEVVANASGELDVAYCLTCIEYERPDLYGVKSLKIIKQGEKILDQDLIFRVGEETFSKKIRISDFYFEVKA